MANFSDFLNNFREVYNLVKDFNSTHARGSYSDARIEREKDGSYSINYRPNIDSRPINPTVQKILNGQGFDYIEPPQDLSVPGATAYDVDTDTTFYTYKPGDTLGQVIKDLGLATKNGLWGSNGDVAYYTQQLRKQGIPGMIPVGRTIRLKGRK